MSAMLCIVAIAANSQTIISLRKGVADPTFRINWGQFFDISKNLNRLEVYYQVFNSDLLFIRNGDSFRADYTLSASVYDNDNAPIANQSRNKEIVTKQYLKTLSLADFRTGQFNFDLPPGKYKIDCHLVDNNSRKTMKESLEATLINYDNRNPQISGIEFVYAADTILYDSAFFKNGLTIIPNVGRLYGEDSSSSLNYYFEVYQGKLESDDIQIETKILDQKLNTVYNDTLSAEFEDSFLAQYRKTALRNLKQGEYTLEIILKGRRGRPVDEIRETFYIFWSPEAMVLNDPKTAVQQLKYVAASNEMKEIEKCENSRERLILWQKFWDQRDPTPGTIENEAKIGYYRRIEHANRRFTVMRREGWKTDRGMIYIMYGEPDQIEDYPFELNRRAYQVWHYYNADNKVREFLFIDEWGNNDFILQYPYDGVQY